MEDDTSEKFHPYEFIVLAQYTSVGILWIGTTFSSFILVSHRQYVGG